MGTVAKGHAGEFLKFRPGVATEYAGGNVPYSNIGADGRASTTPIGNDDGAARFWAPECSEQPAPWGFPVIEWPGPS